VRENYLIKELEYSFREWCGNWDTLNPAELFLGLSNTSQKSKCDLNISLAYVISDVLMEVE
jgi:hypothetical protein